MMADQYTNNMTDSNENKEALKMTDVSEHRRALVKDFSSNVTLHGFRFLIKERGMRKLLWVLIITSTVVLAGILFSDITTAFFTYKALTIFHKENLPVETPFPSVTICNLTPISHNKMLNNLPENMTIKEVSSYYLGTNPIYTTYGTDWSNPRSKKFLERLKLLNISTMYDFEKMVGNDLGTYLGAEGYKMCKFDNITCNVSFFTESATWLFPRCFTFNAYQEDKNKFETKRSGLFSNFIIWGSIYVQDILYQEKWPLQGMAIYIHAYGNPGVISEYTQKIMVPGESFASIELSIKKVIICYLL